MFFAFIAVGLSEIRGYSSAPIGNVEIFYIIKEEK